MEWTKIVSAALVVLVIIWSAGSTAELFLTTLSVGGSVIASGATIAVVALALVAMVLVGVRGSGGIENPDSYW